MLTIPKILDTPEFLDAKLDYKWTNSIEDGMTERVSDILFDTVCPLNHKAQTGLAIAMTEFIYWRLHKFCEKKNIELTTSFSLVEILWTGIIDKQYAVCYPPRIFDIEDAKIVGVISNTDAFLSYTSKRYLKGSYFTYESVPSLVKLARHIAPDKDWFDNWITDIFQRALKLFPALYDVDEIIFERNTYEKMVYDSSLEPSIPREFFFEPDFDYEKAAIIALNQAYLDNLDPNNLFLNPTKEIIENGFEGTPYKYEPK
jgi:hypothetical protein